MIGLKVVMGDPGRKGDPFGIVGTSFNLDDYKIKFKLAKQFKNKPYGEAAHYLQDVKNKIRPNFMGIETNNRGGRVLKLYHEKYKMTWLHGPSIVKGEYENGFMILDTEKMEITAIPLNSKIHVVPEWKDL